MAEAAGVVNRDGRTHDSEFRDAISTSPAEVQELAIAVRALVYDVYPDTVEVVWPKQRSIGWGVGPKKFTEQFAYLMTFKKHATLGFYNGGELPDPAGLLPEAGGTQVSGTLSMRSLKVTRHEDLDRPELRELIDAAVRHQTTLVNE
ncbi:hypothetical protein N802_03480 [Knoellia sinensis KCTC 19936]|uniref:YdhG-like domain-containing protein n=1 Tax=Knoellia sinensis KCTC 19936 TaxID=1385520 RepID=A0A0A0J5T6_9MICO|nr:DUF1801 domain-containing protein [Knoellia sinensis]KGN31437.1 hypothetical protein N802_03480 [Knoellia sinensis KCTC 19936]